MNIAWILGVLWMFPMSIVAYFGIEERTWKKTLADMEIAGHAVSDERDTGDQPAPVLRRSSGNRRTVVSHRPSSSRRHASARSGSATSPRRSTGTRTNTGEARLRTR